MRMVVWIFYLQGFVRVCKAIKKMNILKRTRSIKGQSFFEYMLLLALLVTLGVVISQPVADSINDSVVRAADAIAPPQGGVDIIFADDDSDEGEEYVPWYYAWFNW